MKPTLTDDSATISTSEYFLVSDSTTATYQTEDARITGAIDFANMTAAEQYRIRIYDKVNGGSALPLWEAYLTGVQPGPLVLPTLMVGNGWEISVLKVAGTDRSIAWSVRKLTEGETVVTGSLSANAITAAATASDFGTEIADAVWAFAHETARTAKGVLRRLDALLTGKATGLVGATATFYRADGVTKAIEATQSVALGTRETASTVGGD